MRHTEALAHAKKSALEKHASYYVFHDENDEYFYGDEEDAAEYFFPEELIETVHEDGSIVDHSAFLNPAWEH